LIPPDSGWVNLDRAYGINDAGQIVGEGQLPGYEVVHAFLLSPDVIPIFGPINVGPDPANIAAVATAPDSAAANVVDSRALWPGFDSGALRPVRSECGFPSVAPLAAWAAREPKPDELAEAFLDQTGVG